MALFQIHASAETGDWETFLNLLNKISPDTRDDLNCSIDINSVGPNGNTTLHHACYDGKDEIVLLLISKGANIEAVNAFGNTPLHIAAIRGMEKVATLLLEAGALNRLTPLHQCCYYGHTPLIKLFFEYNADFFIKDRDNRVPLTIAREFLQSGCFTLLQSCMHYQQYRASWLSFYTAIKKAGMTAPSSLTRVMDVPDLVRYLTEYL